jgi:N-methylhydantoinase A
MTAEAAALLSAPLEALVVTRLADMRYRGQGYSVRVPLDSAHHGHALVSRLRERFEQAYRTQYGRTHDDVPIELVNLRVIVRSRFGSAVRPPPVHAARGDVLAARKGSRRAYFGERSGVVECPVFDRYRLGAGHRFEGAAFVEERETTIVIWPGGAFEVDEHGMVVVTVDDQGRPHGH